MKDIGRVTHATADVLRHFLVDTTEDTWGLRIMERTGRPAGTVYVILEKLERAGWVTSAWEEGNTRKGPRRRLYALAPVARAAALDYVRRSDAAVQNSPSAPSLRPSPRWEAG